jgi:hypothetical protein
VTLSCDFSSVTFCLWLFVLWLSVLHSQMKSSQNIQRLGHTKFSSCSSDCVLKTLERASDLKMLIYFSFFVWLSFLMSEMYNIMRKYNSYIFHVFSEARDHILIWNILFFNKLRQIIPEIRCERRDLLIFIFILKTTGTFTPVHSAGYLILRNEFRSTQEVARQNIQVSFYIRSTGLWPNTWIHVSQSLAIIRNAIHILWPVSATRD